MFIYNTICTSGRYLLIFHMHWCGFASCIIWIHLEWNYVNNMELAYLGANQ